MATATDQARQIFRDRGGTLRTREALAAGIHPRVLYGLQRAGELEQLTRGLYRLASLPPMSDPDLATVAKRIPQGVICLISALAYHDLTTQIPHEVHVALPRAARQPRLTYPPLRIFRFSPAAFGVGTETHTIDGVQVRIYNAEKTLADCFKFRNQIGLDVALEALRTYRGRRTHKLTEVLKYARLCRVERTVRPYLEALT